MTSSNSASPSPHPFAPGIDFSEFPSAVNLGHEYVSGRMGQILSAKAEAALRTALLLSPLLPARTCPHIPGSHGPRPGDPEDASYPCPDVSPIRPEQLSPAHELNREVAERVFGCTVTTFRHDYAIAAPTLSPHHCHCIIPGSILLSEDKVGVPHQERPSFEHTADHGPRYLAPYTSDMLWAWKVVRKMAMRGRTHGFFWALREMLNADSDQDYDELGYLMLEQDAPTLATAICLAAVYALSNPSVMDARDELPDPSNPNAPSSDSRSVIRRSIDGGLGSDYPPSRLDNSPENIDFAYGHRPPPYDVVCLGCGAVAFLTDTPPLLELDIQNAYRLSPPPSAFPGPSSPGASLENPIPAQRTDIFDRATVTHANPIPTILCPSCHGWIIDVTSAAGGWQAHIAPAPDASAKVKSRAASRRKNGSLV